MVRAGDLTHPCYPCVGVYPPRKTASGRSRFRTTPPIPIRQQTPPKSVQSATAQHTGISVRFFCFLFGLFNTGNHSPKQQPANEAENIHLTDSFSDTGFLNQWAGVQLQAPASPVRPLSPPSPSSLPNSSNQSNQPITLHLTSHTFFNLHLYCKTSYSLLFLHTHEYSNMDYVEQRMAQEAAKPASETSG